MLRVAAEFSSRKEQLIFLINNYDMMLGVLMVTSPPPYDTPHPPKPRQGGSPNLKGGGGGSSKPVCPHPQERAVEESKEVEGFQQLLSARTQVSPPLYVFWVPPPPLLGGCGGVSGWGVGGLCHRPLPQEFIEEILSPPFGGMIAFVKEAEALLEKGQLERLRGEEGKGRRGGKT